MTGAPPAAAIETVTVAKLLWVGPSTSMADIEFPSGSESLSRTPLAFRVAPWTTLKESLTATGGLLAAEVIAIFDVATLLWFVPSKARYVKLSLVAESPLWV